MNNDTQEKNLIERNDKGIFNKIKKFFRNLFRKKEEKNEIQFDENLESEIEKSNVFRGAVRIVSEEDYKIMQLQEKYRRGEVADNDLTQEQINSLCLLYDKQIKELKKTIESKEQQYNKYKKRYKYSEE